MTAPAQTLAAPAPTLEDLAEGADLYADMRREARDSLRRVLGEPPG